MNNNVLNKFDEKISIAQKEWKKKNGNKDQCWLTKYHA